MRSDLIRRALGARIVFLQSSIRTNRFFSLLNLGFNNMNNQALISAPALGGVVKERFLPEPVVRRGSSFGSERRFQAHILQNRSAGTWVESIVTASVLGTGEMFRERDDG